MRYLIDTNIFLYISTDFNLLSGNVRSIIEDYENSLFINTESVKELVQFYRKQKQKTKFWNNELEMIHSIEKDYGIKILPVKKEHLLTYATLQLNTAQDHKDPSDHIIISHAISEKLPLISSDSKFEYYQKQGLKFIYNSK